MCKMVKVVTAIPLTKPTLNDRLERLWYAKIRWNLSVYFAVYIYIQCWPQRRYTICTVNLPSIQHPNRIFNRWLVRNPLLILIQPVATMILIVYTTQIHVDWMEFLSLSFLHLCFSYLVFSSLSALEFQSYLEWVPWATVYELNAFSKCVKCTSK